jgi:hypothetical protein
MEQLHILRRAAEGIRAEMAEIKTRITGFEGTMGHVMERSAICNRKLPYRPVAWIGLMFVSTVSKNGSTALSGGSIWLLPEGQKSSPY